MLNITDIRIRLVKKEDAKLKAVVSVTIDGCFVIHEIRVIESEKGLFIAMPSKRTPDGEYRDIAHPIDTETRTMLEKKVMEAYEQVVQEKADAE